MISRAAVSQKRTYVTSPGGWELDKETFFIYRNWDLIAEIDDAGNLQKSYIWGLDVDGGGGTTGALLGLVNIQAMTLRSITQHQMPMVMSQA